MAVLNNSIAFKHETVEEARRVILYAIWKEGREVSKDGQEVQEECA